jgi:hypothetical protein
MIAGTKLQSKISGALAITLATLASGCGRDKPTLEEIVVASGSLPGARQSQHQELRAQLREIESTVGLPKDLNRKPVEPNANAAVGLLKALPPGDEFQIKSKEISDTFDELDDVTLIEWYRRAQKLIDDNQKLLATVNEVSDRNACNFLIDFERGYFSDMHFLEAAETACRLQLIAAVLATKKDLLDESHAQLALACRWPDWLANEATIEAQMQAVRLRGDLHWVLQLVATDNRITSDHCRKLSQLLSRSLASWPSDQSALVGDRALAMHSYELARRGLVEYIVSFDEKKVLREEGALDMLRTADEDIIDNDEARYLKYMAQVIELADQPFHERASELRELDRQLAASDAERYAWLANRVFADGLTAAQADMARSHAATRGWWLALQAAAGTPVTEEFHSPLNGELLAIEQVGNRVVVRLNDRESFDPAVKIPEPTATP